MCTVWRSVISGSILKGRVSDRDVPVDSPVDEISTVGNFECQEVTSVCSSPPFPLGGRLGEGVCGTRVRSVGRKVRGTSSSQIRFNKITKQSS